MDPSHGATVRDKTSFIPITKHSQSGRGGLHLLRM